MMLFCLSKKGHTGSVLERTGKATLCLETEKIKNEAMECCKCSGSDTDKFEKLGLESTLPVGFDVPALEGSKLEWAFEIEDTMQARDYIVFLGNITDAALISDKSTLRI